MPESQSKPTVVSPILRIPEAIQADIRAYRGQVERFLNNEIQAVAFRAYRVPMGIYEQRQSGTYMVRTRLGAGLVLPSQLRRIAELSRTYGDGTLHVTTRQALQIHNLRLEDTPTVLEKLLEVGITSRGGGGNTVRNATACPRAGVCPQEVFDVAGHAVAVVEYLLQSPSSFTLPRKYKIVFSGCPADCAHASVADLGFFAHCREGQQGFAVYAGGGLGSRPRVGILLEEFVPEEDIFSVAEAIKRVFETHGDRSNKHKARLRYVLNRVGDTAFRDLYQQERLRLAQEGLPDPTPQWRDLTEVFNHPVSALPPADGLDLTGCLPEKNENTVTVPLSLPLGDISADGLTGVADLATDHSQGLVRGTQDQNLMLTSVPHSHVPQLKKQLADLSISIAAANQPSITACTGAATCKLGLCLSRGLATAIAEELDAVTLPSQMGNSKIKISGCPNACGQHYLGDLGFQGQARRVNGKLMPAYDVLIGGRLTEGQAHLAHKIGSVPARRLPRLVAEAYASGDLSESGLKSLIDPFGQLGPENLGDELFYDFGADEPFSLDGRGPGECSAGVLDIVKADLAQARDSLEEATHQEDSMEQQQSLYQAAVAAARALLPLFGCEPQQDQNVQADFEKHLVQPGWVSETALALLKRQSTAGDFDRQHQLTRCNGLVQRIEDLFKSLDPSLNFTLTKVTDSAPASDPSDSVKANQTIDLRGVACPLNFVKAKLALEQHAVGQTLEILLDAGAPTENVPASFQQQGQEVLAVEPVENHYRVVVRRQK